MRRTRVSEMPAYALRHGSPDKVPAAPIDVFEIACPECDAILCVEKSLLAVAPEFDCACCGREIALTPAGTLRRDRGFPRLVARS